MSLADPVLERSTAPSVLVVEDERIVALDLKLTLESLGYRVVGSAATEREAVRLTLATKPDLVLMDINLEAGGDGIDAANEIHRLADIPVVFLTAYADNEILRRAARAAPYGYLVKPVQHRELNATMQMALARVQASRQCVQAERRLRLALDTARMGVVTLDDDADVVEIDGYCPPIGDSAVRGLRMSVDEFLDRLTDEARVKVRALIEHGGDLHLLTRWRSEGSIGWLEVHASYVAGEAAVIGVCRDVTRQMAQDEALRQAAVVFESAADAILILDPLGRVITANPAFARLTGWTNPEIRGRHPNEFLHARRAADRGLLSDTPADHFGHADVVCLRRDGSNFPAWEHLAPVRNEQGLVTHRVLTFSDISALRQAEGRVHHLAYHDALTGLGNRNQLRELLLGLQTTPTESTPNGVTLLFMDLDGFKHINDSMGHEVGDRLLQTIAERVRQVLRQGDAAIRLGGDEFVLLIHAAEDAEIEALADRLLAVVRTPIELLPGSTVQVSASLGIARHPRDGATPDALLRAADIAKYAAKSGGRNRHARYQPAMAKAASERLSIEQGLLLAMDNGELSLHWQPQVSLADGSPVGAEALLRWQSRQLGPVGPDRFIPIAEECGLIQPLGRWVLRQAVSQWTQWRNQGQVSGRLALNVSALQLLDERFVDDIKQILSETGLPAHELEVEVTETALQRVPQIEQRLTRIANLGVRIALDDFGTGYSSLSMLKLLPLQRLKIDRAFVRELVDNGSDQAIVRAITAIAEALDLALIAEGVEYEDQRQWLLGAGVREAQGWLFAKALPAAEFQQWLAAQRAPRRPSALS